MSETLKKPERGTVITFVGGKLHGTDITYRGVDRILVTGPHREYRRDPSKGTVYKLEATESGWAFVASGTESVAEYHRKHAEAEVTPAREATQ